MDGRHVKGKGMFVVIVLSMIIPLSHASSFWKELAHPRVPIRISSRIRGVVRVKCMSNEDDVQMGYLVGFENKTMSFEVELKFLTAVRYNCIVIRPHGREIGQFLGFRSGSYCENGCDWVLYSRYAQRQSPDNKFVANQAYRQIGTPDDYIYDYS